MNFSNLLSNYFGGFRHSRKFGGFCLIVLGCLFVFVVFFSILGFLKISNQTLTTSRQTAAVLSSSSSTIKKLTAYFFAFFSLLSSSEEERDKDVSLSPYYFGVRQKRVRQGVKLYEWNSESRRQIQQHRIKVFLLLLYDKHGDDDVMTQKLEESLESVAVTFAKKDILHVAVSKEYLPDFRNILHDDVDMMLPLVIILEAHSGWRKYRMYTSPITKTSLEVFEGEYFDGHAKVWLRSENPIPHTSRELVLPIVSSEFENLVIKSRNDVLLYLFAAWCGYCKLFELKFAQLAKKFEKIKSIVFMKMDVNKNDIDNDMIHIERVPHVLLFKAGKKLMMPIQFDHNEKDVVTYGTEFLETHSTCQVNVESGKDCDLGMLTSEL